MTVSSVEHQVTRQVFLWLMACTYMFAFASLYMQIPGLYGSNGLTPIELVMPASAGNSSELSRLASFPSLLIFHKSLQLSPSVAMELVCVVGALLSLVMMMFRAMRCSLLFAFLFALYLSVHKVGQVFLWFQWDSLLLEAGFITIIVAPFNFVFWKRPVARCHDGMTLWLARWLLFRLMFASGVVKLQSQCPTWWGLTALNHHFESQCIPTPLAWYAHHLPSWMLRLGVVGTYWIESVAPLLFFAPVRSLRILGALSQVFLQVLIIVTGNYNFFNLLTVTLSFSLVDDRFFGHVTADSRPSMSQSMCRRVFGVYGGLVHLTARWLAFITVVGVLTSLTVYYFNIRVDSWTILSDTGFSPESLDVAMATAVPLLAIVGAMSLVVEILSSIISSILQISLLSKLWSLLQTLTFTVIVVAMFSVSLVSHGVLDRAFYNSIPAQVRTLHSSLDQFSLTSPYGLFRRMTGVDGRPEVIMEGSMDGDHWKEFEFLYKPGDVTKPPVFVAPHQPRLDWQMWFAALGAYQNNPWLVHLAYKLLLGEPDVLRLMAPPPFQSAPNFVRARLFTYHFTDYDPQRPFYNQTSVWWKRAFKSDYLFSLSVDNQNLIDFVSKHYSLPKGKSSYPASILSNFLSLLRGYSDNYYPLTVLWALFFTGLLVALTMRMLFPDTPLSDPRVENVELRRPPNEPKREETVEVHVRKRHTHRNKNHS